MGDYLSKHSGKAVDDAVDRVNEIDDSELSFLDVVSNAESGIFYKTASGEYASIPLADNVREGSLYLNSGKLYFGELPKEFGGGVETKNVVLTGLYKAEKSIKTKQTSSSNGVTSVITGGDTVDDVEVYAAISGRVVQIRIVFKMPANAVALDGDFVNIKVLSLNDNSKLYSALGISPQHLMPMYTAHLGPNGGKMVFGYIGTSGAVYIASSASKLQAGNKVVLGATYICQEPKEIKTWQDIVRDTVADAALSGI